MTHARPSARPTFLTGAPGQRLVSGQQLADALIPAFQPSLASAPHDLCDSSREAAARSFLAARLAADGRGPTPSPWQQRETNLVLALRPAVAGALAQAAGGLFAGMRAIDGQEPCLPAPPASPRSLPPLAYAQPVIEPLPSFTTARRIPPPLLWRLAGVTTALDVAGLALEARRALVRRLAAGSWPADGAAAPIVQLHGHGALVRIAAPQLTELARQGARRALRSKSFRVEVQGHTLLLSAQQWRHLMVPASRRSGTGAASAYRGSIDGRPLICRMQTLRALLELPGASSEGPQSIRLNGELFVGTVSALRAQIREADGSHDGRAEATRFASPDANELIMVEV